MQSMSTEKIRRMIVLLSLFGCAWAVLVGTARSQTKTDARPQFEVASVKLATDCGRSPDDPGPRGPGVSSQGRLEIRCATLVALIQRAYVGFANGVSFNRTELEVSGGPDWIRSARYEIAAKAG